MAPSAFGANRLGPSFGADLRWTEPGATALVVVGIVLPGEREGGAAVTASVRANVSRTYRRALVNVPW